MKKIMICILIMICSTILSCTKKIEQSDADIINNEIANLENEEDNNKKILNIIKIERKVKTLSIEEKESVNNDLLISIKKETVKLIMDGYTWSEYVDDKETFILLEDILDHKKITSLTVEKPIYSSSYVFTINDISFINDLISLIDLPYLDISGNNDAKDEYYTSKANFRDNCGFYVTFDDAKMGMMIAIYENTYIIINQFDNNETSLRVFIPLIFVDKDLCSHLTSYDNLNKFIES